MKGYYTNRGEKKCCPASYRVSQWKCFSWTLFTLQIHFHNNLGHVSAAQDPVRSTAFLIFIEVLFYVQRHACVLGCVLLLTTFWCGACRALLTFEPNLQEKVQCQEWKHRSAGTHKLPHTRLKQQGRLAGTITLRSGSNTRPSVRSAEGNRRYVSALLHRGDSCSSVQTEMKGVTVHGPAVRRVISGDFKPMMKGFVVIIFINEASLVNNNASLFVIKPK